MLLAQNAQGLKNLFKLTTIGYTEGFYAKPRIDWEVLERYSEGVICLSACLAGYSQRLINEGRLEAAKSVICCFQQIFKDRFFLEIQPNRIEGQKKVNQAFIEWSKELNIPLVATTDVHYLRPEDFETHKVFTKISGFDAKDTYKDNYWLSSKELIDKFVSQTGIQENIAKEAVRNTVKIAEMVQDYEIDTSVKLPHFTIPEQFANENEYLKHLCQVGWEKRGIEQYSQQEQKRYQNRLQVELDVIFNKGFSGKLTRSQSLFQTNRIVSMTL